MKYEEKRRCFSFRNAIILDKSRDIDHGYFEIKDPVFTDLLEKFLEKGDSDLHKILGYREFVDLFPGYFTPEADPMYEFHISFVQEKLGQVTVLEKKLDLSGFRLIDSRFKDFVENTSQVKFSKTHATLDLPKSKTSCPNPKAYLAVIDPEHIKIGINGVIQEKAYLLVLSKPPCQEESIDVQQIAKEVSVTFLCLLVSNFLKDMLFSFLNNKDVLDVVKFHEFPKAEKYLEFDAFFSTFDCSQFPAIYDQSASFRSNQRIKSVLLGESLGTETSDWQLLEEYQRQYLEKLPRFVRLGTQCLYNPIFPEYVMLGLVALFWMSSCVHACSVSLQTKSSGKTMTLPKGVARIKTFFYQTLTNSILLIYFYNLASFCTLGKLVKSLSFGAVDFGLLCVRGAVLTFPLFGMLTEVFKESELSKQTKRRSTRTRRRKKLQTKRNIPNTFVEDFSFKKVYATWTRNKNEVIAHLRISYKDLGGSRPLKRKTIFRKHVLQIIDQERRPVKPRPKRSKIHIVLYKTTKPKKTKFR